MNFKRLMQIRDGKNDVEAVKRLIEEKKANGEYPMGSAENYGRTRNVRFTDRNYKHWDLERNVPDFEPIGIAEKWVNGVRKEVALQSWDDIIKFYKWKGRDKTPKFSASIYER